MTLQCLEAGANRGLSGSAAVDRRQEIEARNRLDGLVYSVDKTFNENKEKVDAAVASELESAIAEAKTALGGSDPEPMNNAFERLQTASHKLAEAIYTQTANAPEGEAHPSEQASSASAGAEGDSGSTSAGDDNVIDAEYVDVDENK